MDRRSLVSLIAVQSLFGLWPVAGKIAFQSFHPLALSAIRIGVAALILLVLQHFLVKDKLDLRRDGGFVAVLAFFGVIMNQGLFAVGLDKTTAINTTLIITTIPVVTYAIAVLMGRETWGPRRIVGLLFAITGVVYLIGLSGSQFGWDHAVGDILIFINCLSFSFYLVLSKPLATRVHPLSLIAWQFAFAALIMVPIGFAFGVVPQASAAPPFQWGIMAFIILGPTVATYVLNATALRNVTSSTVAVFIYIQPLFTTTFAWYFLGEELSWRLLPAAVLVFVGVGIVAWRSRTAAAAVPQD